jgi:hypothetical protein
LRTDDARKEVVGAIIFIALERAAVRPPASRVGSNNILSSRGWWRRSVAMRRGAIEQRFSGAAGSLPLVGAEFA